MLSFCALAVAGVAQAQNQEPLPIRIPTYYNPDKSTPAVKNLQTDVCIYGGNSAGVATALQLSRNGKTSIIIEPSNHLGGLSAGGLGETDIGNKAAIGGISREFYGRIGQKYGVAEEWKFEPHVAETVFKEMVAEAKAPVYFRQFLKSVQKEGGRIASITLESGITVNAKMFVDCSYEGDLMAKAGVKYTIGRESNATYNEKNNGIQVHPLHQFDLAVDPYVVAGNPASGLLPGINPEPIPPTGTGDKKVQAYNFRLCLTNDPANRIPFEKPTGYDAKQFVLLGRYLKAGWPASEVFRKFDPIRNSFAAGENATPTSLQVADVKDAKNLLTKLKKAGGPFTLYLKQKFSPALQTKLNAYDGQVPSPELLQAVISELNGQIAGPLFYTPELFAKVQMSAATRQQIAQNPTGEALRRLHVRLLLESYPSELGFKTYQKVDKNNHGAISTDFIGANFDYPEADYATRERIFQQHVTYQKSLMWFMGNDPSVPEAIRTRWSQWGLPKDEFQETGGWPHQFYVREARRMLGGYVMTESNCRAQEVVPDAVGLAAYTMDSHNVQRFVRDGRVWNEGDVQEKGVLPYPISYRSITPKKAECENLLVPVCLSASHIAYGSIRMEPVFMILGQSSADAATIAIDKGIALQDVAYSELRAKLDAQKQVLQWGTQAQPAPITNLETDSQAALRGFFGRLQNGQKQTVVFYGTSLTRNGAWTTAVQNWLNQKFPGQVTCFNSGLSGKNSDEGVAQMQTQLLAHKPDLAFIEFSINDSHKKFDMPIERGASNLDQIVKALRAQNSSAAIVLQVMDVPWDAPNGNRSLTDRPQLQAFNDNYRTYARQHALPLIDHNADWLRLKETDSDNYHAYLADGLHPNKDGDLAITWPAIETLLSTINTKK